MVSNRDAQNLRAVRVLGGFTLGVMFAMDRGPFLGHHARGEPQPETEEMADQRVQIECTVRLVAVQVDRDAGDRDMGKDKGNNNIAPPRQGNQTF